jgi:hypothetical protein
MFVSKNQLASTCFHLRKNRQSGLLPPVIETLALTTATVADNMFQLRQVTTEEVSEIITMMPSNKAPETIQSI